MSAENTDREREVKSLLKNVGSIHEVFSEDAEIVDDFKFSKEEFEEQREMLNKGDVKASIEEIEKMDVVLKGKIIEEKKAKLFRIQAEEESRIILSKLLCFEMSSAIKINFREFMKLLGEVEKAQNDSFDLFGQDSLTQGNSTKGEKKEKAVNLKFVERNIQLAKCGHGTLSLTDKEKVRIKNLLMDIEDSEVENIEELKKAENLQTKVISKNEKKFFAIDEETKIILNQIDQKLEMLNQEKSRQERNQSKLSFLKKTESEDKSSKEYEKEKSKKEELNRLKEINKLLNSMNSVSNEEINPLTVEEIGSLILGSEQNLSLGRFVMTEEKERLSAKPPEEVIAKLVSNAKLLMPKFQYKFDEA